MFKQWEVVQAELQGIKLNSFDLAGYGIPYGYSPVLAADAKAVEDPAKKEQIKKVLKATAKGYAWAASHPDEVRTAQPLSRYPHSNLLHIIVSVHCIAERGNADLGARYPVSIAKATLQHNHTATLPLCYSASLYLMKGNFLNEPSNSLN